jgi:hypothetical protein
MSEARNPSRQLQLRSTHAQPGGRGWGTFVALAVALLVVVFTARSTHAQSTYEADIRTIASQADRGLGSPGHEATLQFVRDRLATYPNVVVQEHEFEMMVPRSSEATLTVDGRSVTVHPFVPAHIRLVATPAAGITGKLVYASNCEYDQLRPALLDGNIAVVEPTAGSRWLRAFSFGARAVIVLSDPKELSWMRMRGFEVRPPGDLPRLFLDDADLARRLREQSQVPLEGTQLQATLLVKSDWTPIRAKNIYAFIPGTDAMPETGTPVMTFLSQTEGTSLVVGRAPGAGQASNLAATLELLDVFAKNAPKRPVLFAFTSGDSVQFRGSREMLMALADAPQMWQRDVGTDDDESTLRGKRVAAQLDLETLQRARTSPWTLDTRKDAHALHRAAKAIDTTVSINQEILFKLRIKTPAELTDDDQAMIQELADQGVPLSETRAALVERPHELNSDSMRGIALDYVGRTIDLLQGTRSSPGLISQYDARLAELWRRQTLYQWLAKLTGRDANPGVNSTNQRLLDTVIAIDLSDRGVRAGIGYWGQFLRSSNKSAIDRNGWFATLAADLRDNKGTAEWFKPLSSIIDLSTLTTQRTPTSFQGAMVLPTEMSLSWGVPGMTVLTLDDMRALRDTPADTLDRLDVKAIRLQLDAVRELLVRAVNEPRFGGQPGLNRQRQQGFGGLVASAARGKPVPDLGRSGFLVTYNPVSNAARIPGFAWTPYSPGLRRTEVEAASVAGEWRFEGFSKMSAGDYLNRLHAQAFRIEPGTGAVIGASDMGRIAMDIVPFAVMKDTTINPIRLVPFSAQEFTLVGLYDPRYLQGLGEMQLLDARRNAEPQKYHATLADTIFAAFVEPGARSYLLFRYGRIGNRLVLLNMPRDEATIADLPPGIDEARARKLGQGLSIDRLRHLGPLSLATAADFAQLDDNRLKSYRSAGVSSKLIDELHAKSESQIDSARAATTQPSLTASDVVRDANGAWANSALVYAAARSMSDDVVRAAIFLLILSVFFSICMERLLIASPNVYRQLGGIAGIFLVMCVALYLFHPAFKISASPLIIILAFAIIFMSVFVIIVVYQKFDSELKKIRSGRGTSEGATFARGSVLTQAVMLGIANMRKRKIRTFLTGTTIVLITFAVLVFASATSFRGTQKLPAGIASDHPGVMLRQRGFRPMEQTLVSDLRAVLAGDEVWDNVVKEKNKRRQPGEPEITKLDAKPQVGIAERWWNISAADPNEQVNLVYGGASVNGKAATVVALPALLGITPEEARVSPVESILGAEKFAKLKTRTDIIYLASDTAKQLGVTGEGDKVRIGGFELEVAGIFDPAEFERKAYTLSGEPIMPLKFESNALDASGKKLSDSGADQLELDAESAASELASSYQHLPGNQFAIIHAEVSKQLYGARLASVALRVDDYDMAKVVADEIAGRFTVVIFAGLDGGVQMISASNLSKIQGSAVAIPLLIGGLIIFNTMMGSIAERKREIHIYTSLGLAPMHVGALFVAEALTYGVLGTVFGYVIGQGVGTFMLKMGWLGTMTLDYSGTSAMLTIGLILLVVLLSALVPARLASKIAAPSIERSWRVPPPKDGRIVAMLPFTINRTAAEGAIAYLAEFFDAHREGSIGKFAADKPQVFKDDEGKRADGSLRAVRGLSTTIWLTPFDLGVRQNLTLLIQASDIQDVYEVQVLLDRLSGDDGSWYRMNRPFLTELRKQFLQWRSLSPARMREFVQESKKLFEKPAPAELVNA